MFYDLPDDSFSLFFFFFFLCFSMFSPFLARVAFLFFFFFSLLVFGKLVDWIYVETGDTEDCKDLEVLGIPWGE